MFEALHQGGSLARDSLWQSTMFLGLGLAMSMVLARRPARAHRCLLLAMLAALVSPILTQAVRREGWGLFAPAMEPDAFAGSSSSAPPVARASRPVSAPPPVVRARSLPPTQVAEPEALDRPKATHRPSKLADLAHRPPAPIAWRTLVAGVWLTLAGLAALRLVFGVILGVNLVRRARIVKSETLAAAAASASSLLGVPEAPELRASPQVRCPSIWCWGRNPVIVLPQDAEAGAPLDWVGVFCHELAHWVRRDYWSSLLAAVLACALPWHPLAWWARQRLGKLSELACDDWVLSTGLPAADYAESLLNLIPERCGAVALAAVSSRGGLIGRIRHILTDRRTSPAVGVRWAWSSAAAMVLAASAVALAQSRPAAVEQTGPRPRDDAQPSKTSSTASTTTPPPTKRTVSGTVIGPDGKPVSGATVFWLGEQVPHLADIVGPMDLNQERSTGAQVLARADTGADGTFSLTATYDLKRYLHDSRREINLLARAPGLGIRPQWIKADDAPVTLRLPAEVVIRGRLLTPGGMPAQGVRVTLDGFIYDQHSDDMYIGPIPPEKQVPSYWPAPRTTDADGKFTLEGVPEGFFATLTFWHPDYAVDDVTVNTTGNDALTPGVKAVEIVPVKPSFTHSLEPSRPVQGRVIDKQSGKPLAGLLVQMTPMRRHGGIAFSGRTDADGRYRIFGHGGASSYFTRVYPPAGSGYLAVTENDTEWPAGAKLLEKNFALEKGPMVHGRVIDADSRQPVAEAAVVYQPRPENPNEGDHDFTNTVLTGADGQFAITALPGQGFLAVETPDENYVRVPLDNSGQIETLYPQGFVSIDIAKAQDPKPVEITVRKGITLEAKATGPDGKVVTALIGYCEGIDARLIEIWNQGQPFEDGVFRLPGADPLRTYRVHLLHAARQIGAVADLKPDPQAKQPFEVKLEPTAKVHGTVKSTGGTPIAGASVFPMLVIREKDGLMTRDDVFASTSFYSDLIGETNLTYSERQRSNAQGEFVIDTLLPGVRLYVFGASGNREAQVPLKPLRPGEDRDLGTITLKETEP
jgi:beta-lactamase regulating signal transducer with metallopeptidase domain